MQTEEALRNLIRQKFKDLTEEEIELIYKVMKKLASKRKAKKKD